MTCHAHTHGISGRRHNNLPVCPIKGSPSWSHMPTKITEGTCLRNFCQSVKKIIHQEEVRERKHSNCKAFCVTCIRKRAVLIEHVRMKQKQHHCQQNTVTLEPDLYGLAHIPKSLMRNTEVLFKIQNCKPRLVVFSVVIQF